MNSKLRAVLVVAAAAGLTAVYGVSNAQVTRYVEDFSTTTYKDAGKTTAWWDTSWEQLRLYPYVPSLTGSYNTPGFSYEVALAGDVAYVADYTAGLRVIDVTNLAAPVSIGSYDTPGNAYSVFADGDWVYLADGDDGLLVFDVTDPSLPALSGSYDTPGSAFDLCVAGDLAFVADGTSGLQVIDVSNPSAPASVGSYNTPSFATGVVVSGNYAYIADGGAGLRVIDITDPAAPFEAGFFDTPDYAYGLCIDGKRVYVADYATGLVIFDVTDPTSPVFLDSYGTFGDAQKVCVAGDRAYVGDRSAGLQVIDVSDPYAPEISGWYDTIGYGTGVEVAGEHVFLADGGGGLAVIQIAERVPPTLAGSNSTIFVMDDIEVHENLAYIAERFDGLRIMDVGDPTAPVLVGSYILPNGCGAVDVDGHYAYLGQSSYSEPFVIVDVSDPATPTQVASYVTPDVVWDVFVSGDLAYVTCRNAGLVIFDVSDPSNPDSIGAVFTDYGADGLEVSGDHAYIGNGGSGLQVVDVSDPTTPVVVGIYDPPGVIRRLRVLGNHVYAANVDSGLVVIDVSDPTAPTGVGSYSLPNPVFDIDVTGNYAFLVNSENGMRIVDVSDPTTPTLVGTYAASVGLSLCVEGDYAYTTVSEAGLTLVQIFQGDVVSPSGWGRSLEVDQGGDNFVRVSLDASQTDHVSWEISVNGGSNWHSIQPDGTWMFPPLRGSDLRWRSSLLWQKPGDDPSVDDLTIDWRYDHGVITSITDVPGDQGGWVRVVFTRSGRDFEEETSQPVDDYGIWQRVDDPLLVSAVDASAASAAGKEAETIARTEGGIPVVFHNGRSFVRSGPDPAEGVFPPGTWELVSSVPAAQQDSYIARVPTTADSTVHGQHYSVYVLTAHTTTPSIWYAGYPDSGYSVDNIAPAVPGNFAAAYNTGAGNHLTWDVCPDDDFQYHNVYRSTDPGFDPSPATRVHSTIDTEWYDPEYDGWNVHYKVTALDYAGNESPPASAGTATGADARTAPKRVTLEQNVPNPFNPSTSITIGLPSAAPVRLTVYDVGGRRVATLADGPVPAGYRSFTWNGRDDTGARVGSGVYFCRLETGGETFTRKMILLK